MIYRNLRDAKCLPYNSKDSLRGYHNLEDAKHLQDIFIGKTQSVFQVYYIKCIVSSYKPSTSS